MTVRRGFNGAVLDLSEARARVVVTDHAVLRWLERVEHVDIAAVRRRIVSEAVLQAMAMGATSVRGDGFKLVIQNFTVITTLPAGAVALPASHREGDR